MIKGMKFPIKLGTNGGAHMIYGADVIKQNILLAILPADSRHPWNQDLTPEENIIFGINDNVEEDQIIFHIKEVFREYERNGYARLFPGREGVRIVRDSDNNSGVLNVYLRYQDLEYGKNRSMNFSIPGGK